MSAARIFSFSMFWTFTIALSSYAQGQLLELQFKQSADSGTWKSRALQSLVRVRNVNEQYSTGGLYLMTCPGESDELFQEENRRAMDHPMINETWRFCSVFSTKNEDAVVMGRNWDNQNVGSIIVSLYHPRRGYASISFSRAIDMGFPLNVDLVGMASSPYASKLLLAPFYATDGLNDHGLCVSVTGVQNTTIGPKDGKELLFITYVVRKILDQAQSIDEAVRLAEGYIPFDLDRNSLNSHYYLADASGRSVILEYGQNGWRKIYPGRSWQVMTNNVIDSVPDTTLRRQCWRYRKICETLEKTDGKLDWRAGMQLLKDVSQNGTTWSVVYSPTSRDLHFVVYQSWDKIYHLQGF